MPRRLAEIAGLAVLYLALARAGLMLTAVSGFASLIWPASGLALAAVLLRGAHVWPGIFVAALVVNLWSGAAPLAAFGIAIGNTASALLARVLLRGVSGFTPTLERLRDVLAFLAIAVVLIPAFGASVGVGSLQASGAVGEGALLETWRAWFVGDLMGNLVVTPLLVVWARPATWAVPLRQRLLEGIPLTALISVLSLAVFATPHDWHLEAGPLAYVVFPGLMWAALRFGQRGAVISTFLVAAIAIAGTMDGRGAFAQSETHDALFLLQSFMAILGATFLIVGTVIRERELAMRALTQAHDELELRVRERTAALSTANVELRRREEQLSEAQALAHLGSWEWDVERDVIVWSDELYNIYGLQKGEAPLSYEAFLRRVHPDDREPTDSAIRRAVSGASSFELEHRIYRPDGEQRTLLARGRAAVDATGKIVRLMGTGQDITERKQAEEILRRAHDELELRVAERTEKLAAAVQARDAFISIASHELKTPLTALQLAVQVLMRQLDKQGPVAPTVQNNLQRIDRNVGRLGLLIDNLLDVSRITAGRLQLQLEEVDLAEVAREVAGRFEEELRRAGSALSVHDGTPVPGRWDRLRLEQVLTNLLSNAVKYGAGSPIEVVVEGDQTVGRIVVRDRGMGVAPGDRERLFQPFERLVPESHSSGFGLGLWIVRQIVDALGGSIRVESELGKGASFVVELPRQSGRG